MRTQNSKVKSQELFVRACSLALLLTCSLLFAMPATMHRAPGKRIYDTKFLDINRWHVPFYNNGEIAIDLTQINFPGGYWPAPTRNFHLFGGGLWVGAISATGDTLVSVGYNPNSGGCEYYPTTAAHYTEGTSIATDRVYKYGTADWPPSQARYGTDPKLVPQDNFSLQDLWMAFTDAAPGQHVSPGKPLGLDVYLTVYAWNYPANQDIFFCNYKVKNSTGDAFGTKSDLHNVYFGLNFDIDIGTADDDMVGMILNRVFNNGKDTVKNVGYAGDNINSENPSAKWQGGRPGTVCVKYLQSPRRPNDTAQLGMTAFKRFTLDIDPITDATQYLTMAGIDYRTGIYSAYDSIDEAPADKRIIECSGPFDLPADSVQNVIAAVFCVYYGTPGELWINRTEADLADMVKTAQSAQFIYDRGWLLPGPPESPSVTLIPMDNKVRITWDNKSETSPDKYFVVASDSTNIGWDPAYKQYDFKGYKIWKSRNGADWKLLTQCDLANGDTFTDTLVADSIATKARNTGIFYSFLDDSVINGYTYYYTVSAYDHNWTTVWDTLTPHHPIDSVRMTPLEGGKRAVAVIPRWEAANAVPARAFVKKITGDTLSPALTCSAQVVIPFEVSAGDTYVLQLLPPQYISANVVKYRWVVKDIKNDSMLQDTAGVIYNIIDFATSAIVRNDLPTIGGLTTKMRFKMGNPDSSYSGIQVATGNYPVDSLRPGGTPSSAYWAYRGSDYQLQWHVTNGAKTLTVIDVTNGGIEVPFDSFKTNSNGPAKANCWCFGFATTAASETLRASDKAIYICGMYVAFRPNLAVIGDPLKALINDGDVWNVTGYKRKNTSPAYNMFYIYGAPESLAKVVYNPLGTLHHLGTGLNNITFDGLYNGTKAVDTFFVYVSGTGMPDTVKWKESRTGLWSAPLPLTGQDQVMQNGITFKAASLNGHTLGDTWVQSVALGKLRVRVVPNPYFITNAWETDPFNRHLAFTGLPANCEIRIFNLAGDLVKMIPHHETGTPTAGQPLPQPGALGGTEFWDLVNDYKQLISTGVYIYHVKSDVGEQVGKFAIAR